MIRIISLFLLFSACFPTTASSMPEEVEKLKLAFGEEVSHAVHGDIHQKTVEQEVFRLVSGKKSFFNPQYAVFIDRNPGSQTGSVVYVDLAAKRVVIIGVFPVSTGNPHRRGHFETPVGIFQNSPENMNYRALGTKNSKGWRGFGKKGSRVWDFGWKETKLLTGSPYQIRLLMHATDPDFGEPRLGKVDSKGCVRVPARVNAFLDRYGILDASYENGSSRARAVLLRERAPAQSAGQYLIVGDSRFSQGT